MYDGWGNYVSPEQQQARQQSADGWVYGIVGDIPAWMNDPPFTNVHDLDAAMVGEAMRRMGHATMGYRVYRTDASGETVIDVPTYESRRQSGLDDLGSPPRAFYEDEAYLQPYPEQQSELNRMGVDTTENNSADILAKLKVELISGGIKFPATYREMPTHPLHILSLAKELRIDFTDISMAEIVGLVEKTINEYFLAWRGSLSGVQTSVCRADGSMATIEEIVQFFANRRIVIGSVINIADGDGYFEKTRPRYVKSRGEMPDDRFPNHRYSARVIDIDPDKDEVTLIENPGIDTLRTTSLRGLITRSRPNPV